MTWQSHLGIHQYLVERHKHMEQCRLSSTRTPEDRWVKIQGLNTKRVSVVRTSVVSRVSDGIRLSFRIALRRSLSKCQWGAHLQAQGAYPEVVSSRCRKGFETPWGGRWKTPPWTLEDEFPLILLTWDGSTQLVFREVQKEHVVESPELAWWVESLKSLLGWCSWSIYTVTVCVMDAGYGQSLTFNKKSFRPDPPRMCLNVLVMSLVPSFDCCRSRPGKSQQQRPGCDTEMFETIALCRIRRVF